jgi:Phage head-tail joining protein
MWIQQPVRVGSKQTFQNWQRAWGFVDPQRSVEMASALGPENMNWYLVTLPYIPGVRPKMRLQYTSREGTQTLEIAGVTDVRTRHYELQLNCTQVVS